jgi:predicted TIM-barrel fold metal-dependent hydrolase
MFPVSVLQFACHTLGAERILFAIDYPFEPNQAGTGFIKQASLDAEEKQKICSRNTEKWLHIPA